ncbi:N-acetylmuramoyl-L-alanine amidase [Ureibacillus terrenus]|uniref:SH3 domain-containing protein n=1 Tax=Ureibacillus terrenus TaxID=118246 RepID=A0A540V3W1_9BACL|nr:N-acetylmuramoyl-L-alanine amidase [Ureibacillus terrenus]TQE91442.1 SH3 domain-containing protein [Ureibacillus terrenus]
MFLKKWIIILGLLLLASFCGFPSKALAGQVFDDVPPTHEAYEYINYLESMGVIKGYTENGRRIFRLADPVTRGQAAKMVVIGAGYEPLKVSRSSFVDVDPAKNPELSGYVERAASLGLFDNITDNRFKPYTNLTRGEMSKVIAKAFKLDIEQYASHPSPFCDIPADHPYFKYINALYYNGIAQGSNGKFNPDSHLTRTQFALLVARTMNSQFRLDVKPVNQNACVPEKTDTIGRATVNNLHVRSAASGSAPTIGKLNRGDQVYVISINGWWAKINYKGSVGYTHKSYLKLLNQSGSKVKNRIIVLDPGHGGTDPGATKGSYQEKQIALAVANVVKQKLEKDGATVYMTRTGDTYPSLQDRVDFAHEHYAEVFVSIHANSSTSSSAKGTETYYSITANDNELEDYALATSINNEIVKQAKMVNRGVKRADFYVIRHSVFPSVLVELGFISNGEDLSKLIDSNYQQIFGNAIYQGIVNYYSK